MRSMLAAFTDDEWDDLYAQIYDNIAPGGWIEQLEVSAYGLLVLVNLLTHASLTL